MFTGLVEETGVVVRALLLTEVGARLAVHARKIGSGAQIGDSVAVNGCCLTVTGEADGVLEFDLLAETLARTNLGRLEPGSPVNLERALAASSRLGGHFVQGHIDGTSEILSFAEIGADRRLEVSLAPEVARYVAFKGSVAIDGISLTVAEVHAASFVVWIIPHTAVVTNLGTRRVGDLVNLEVDLLAKYVERILAFKPA